jgi:hypothetical protein
MRVNFGVHLSACRQPGLSDTPDDPGMVLLYTISELSPQYLNKKSPPVGGGLRLYKGDKTVSTISLKSGLVNVLYPPHEHLFAKGVFHSIYPSSD